MDDVDITLAVRSIFFAAVGTVGQHCTTYWRLVLKPRIQNFNVATCDFCKEYAMTFCSRSDIL